MTTRQGNPLSADLWHDFPHDVTLHAGAASQCYQAVSGLWTIVHLLANDQTAQEAAAGGDPDAAPLSLVDRAGLLSAAAALIDVLNRHFEDLHGTTQGQGEAKKC